MSSVEYTATFDPSEKSLNGLLITDILMNNKVAGKLKVNLHSSLIMNEVTISICNPDGEWNVGTVVEETIPQKRLIVKRFADQPLILAYADSLIKEVASLVFTMGVDKLVKVNEKLTKETAELILKTVKEQCRYAISLYLAGNISEYGFSKHNLNGHTNSSDNFPFDY